MIAVLLGKYQIGLGVRIDCEFGALEIFIGPLLIVWKWGKSEHGE